ncbi:MAG: hypothetical protein DMF96_25555 [Acidobacteria bacterium]|nr:MAG: hypothetical protein DMF96_25555 [Acidobacteriota bacterium]
MKNARASALPTLNAIVDVDAAARAGWRPVDLARAFISADGVHVGQDDLAPAAVRLLVGEHAIVGLSTHTLEQVDEAVRLSVGPSRAITYVAIGPVFGTTTKATGYEAIGLAMVREASRRAGARGLPLVAIGGITLERAASVIEAGAASVAVISDLLATGDPEGRVREFIARLSMANG